MEWRTRAKYRESVKIGGDSRAWLISGKNKMSFHVRWTTFQATLSALADFYISKYAPKTIFEMLANF